MPQNGMRGANGAQRGNFAGGVVPVERWTGIVVLVALGVLILIRMGFRGVNVFGVSAQVN